MNLTGFSLAWVTVTGTGRMLCLGFPCCKMGMRTALFLSHEQRGSVLGTSSSRAALHAESFASTLQGHAILPGTSQPPRGTPGAAPLLAGGFPSSLLLLHPHSSFSFPMSIMLWMSLTRCRCRMTKRKPTCSYLCPPAAPCSWSGTLISAVLLHGPDTHCHLWHPAGLPEIIGELGGIPMYVEKIKKLDFA